MADVVGPLLALGFEEVLEDVLAERVADEVVLLELVERLAEVRRQVVDAQVTPLAVAHRVDVLVHRRPGIDLLVDAVEPGPQHHRQREVRIARRVRHPHSIRVAVPRAAGTRTSGLRFFSDHAIAVGAS